MPWDDATDQRAEAMAQEWPCPLGPRAFRRSSLDVAQHNTIHVTPKKKKGIASLLLRPVPARPLSSLWSPTPLSSTMRLYYFPLPFGLRGFSPTTLSA